MLGTGDEIANRLTWSLLFSGGLGSSGGKKYYSNSQINTPSPTVVSAVKETHQIRQPF